jgi:RNA polymerase sigma-70 factor (ECF subfamily)
MNLLNWLLWALSFAAFDVIKGDTARAESTEAQDALLARAKEADPAALAQLYDQYSLRIYNYVFHRVAQAELAEDMTAQVFVRMLESVRQGRGWQSSFSGWLFRIAHNLVIDHYRRRRRATVVELDETTPVLDQAGDPVRRTEAQLEIDAMRKALGKLTEEQAQVITLRFLEDLSIAEAAAAMNKTEGAIKALQYRAVLALRRVMQT